ncbi:unnamed protein product [Staurois parvus]|uniref:Uncharacterized protein n=1 Tax=Staurois parvus TaxID=386267 RepID=A0ABN9CDR7_9NEOB|nr:unnamed protein product [Staurois parvus]
MELDIDTVMLERKGLPQTVWPQGWKCIIVKKCLLETPDLNLYEWPYRAD